MQPRKMRQVKFRPKGESSRKEPKVEVKTEVVEDDDTARTMATLKRLSDASSLKRKPKVEKKEHGFGGVGASSTFMKSYGNPKVEITDNRKPAFGGATSSSLKREKEYKEPWDYYSYYPTCLPLRRPHSGNPDILNEEEFAETLEDMPFEESAINPGEEIGLMEENPDPNLMLFKLPSNFPMLKPSATANDQEASGSSNRPKGKFTREHTCKPEELPEGYMGQLLIYKSGAMKLKVGDALYDVSPGVESDFPQNVVAINTEEKHCCVIGEVNKCATVSPDINFLLNSMTDLELN